jgi:polyketide cyclase/dehydrase/lipid transport protein
MTLAAVTGWIIVAALLAALLAVFLWIGRLDLRRTVLVHTRPDRVWDFVRHFPTLHARHGKALGLGSVDSWSLARGDGESAGSVWRAGGLWGEAPYWAEIEIVRCRPGRELAVTLLRDSLGTHRGLRRHLGSLLVEPIAPETTKLTWSLRVRLRGLRLRVARIRSPASLQARLFDQGLRSIKMTIESAVELPAAGGSTVADPARVPPPASPPAGPSRPGRRPPEPSA